MSAFGRAVPVIQPEPSEGIPYFSCCCSALPSSSSSWATSIPRRGKWSFCCGEPQRPALCVVRVSAVICGEYNHQNGAQCAVEGEKVARGDNNETLKGSRAIMWSKWWGSDQASPSNRCAMLLQLSQDVLSTCYGALPINTLQVENWFSWKGTCEMCQIIIVIIFYNCLHYSHL